MQTFAEEQHIMLQPSRSLIGSYFGEKILLATPLIKWYLEHGLEVTRIYQVVEYTPVPCFQPFGEAVSDARRAGDVDPYKAIIADTMKLVSMTSFVQAFCHFFPHANLINVLIHYLLGREFQLREDDHGPRTPPRSPVL